MKTLLPSFRKHINYFKASEIKHFLKYHVHPFYKKEKNKVFPFKFQLFLFRLYMQDISEYTNTNHTHSMFFFYWKLFFLGLKWSLVSIQPITVNISSTVFINNACFVSTHHFLLAVPLTKAVRPGGVNAVCPSVSSCSGMLLFWPKLPGTGFIFQPLLF